MATAPDQQGVIFIEEESLKESYTSIPNTILKRDDLSPGAKLAYVMLLTYAHQTDRCFPGQARLAKDMGVGERSLIRYLKELQDRHLLKVKRQGLGRTNIYTLAKWVKPRSAKLADHELPRTTHPEVPKRQIEKDQEEKTKINSINGDKYHFTEERHRHVRSSFKAIKEVLQHRVSGDKALSEYDWLAQEMAAVTGDERSLGCYKLIAKSCPQELVFEAVALLKEAQRDGSIRQSRGALFVGIVRRLCQERGLPDPLAKPSPRSAVRARAPAGE